MTRNRFATRRRPPAGPGIGDDPDQFGVGIPPQWFDAVRAAVKGHLTQFLATECMVDLESANVDIAGSVLSNLLGGGKYLRSTFMYLGWLCGASEDDGALRASASLEFLHAFALLQDDVMDQSKMRRGRPSAHVEFGRWHRERRLAGLPERFGDSAAILLGDLCLVWASKMLRECGVDAEALARVWPSYDAMRVELVVGQFADLANESRSFPSLDQVLDVLRRKSGNYTVRRPLEIGSAMAGCQPQTIDALGEYGGAIGEAFQLRDDLLGVFGSQAVTGKPVGTDLADHKATSVVVVAHEMASPVVRGQLSELMTTSVLSQGDIERWRGLIVASGAVQRIEQLIDDRVRWALRQLDTAPFRQVPRAALEAMAVVCTERAA